MYVFSGWRTGNELYDLGVIYIRTFILLFSSLTFGGHANHRPARKAGTQKVNRKVGE